MSIFTFAISKPLLSCDKNEITASSDHALPRSQASQEGSRLLFQAGRS
jgi:hypothetical protein